MVTLSYEVSDANATLVVNALAARYGYTPTLPDPVNQGQTIPNPETKAQFAKRMIWEIVKAEVNQYRVNQAAATADTSDIPATIG